MHSRVLKYAVATSAAAGMMTLAMGAAYASAGVNPPSKPIVAKSTSLKFAGLLDNKSFTATCTGSQIAFTTPATGYGPVPVTGTPTFTGCTDNFGGTDTITATSISSWSVSFVVSPLSVKVGLGGATFTTTALPGCTVTAGGTTITGSYNNTTFKFSIVAASIPFSGVGCGPVGTTGTATGTYTASPGFTIT